MYSFGAFVWLYYTLKENFFQVFTIISHTTRQLFLQKLPHVLHLCNLLKAKWVEKQPFSNQKRLAGQGVGMVCVEFRSCAECKRKFELKQDVLQLVLKRCQATPLFNLLQTSRKLPLANCCNPAKLRSWLANALLYTPGANTIVALSKPVLPVPTETACHCCSVPM